jgi:hypothetical protein
MSFLTKAIAKTNDFISGFGHEITPDNLIGAPPFDYTRRQLMVQNFIPIHTWLLNRSCIEKTGMFDKNLDRLEDYDLLLKMSSLYPFHHLRKVTCEYRFYLHSVNSIYTDRRKSLDSLKVIYDRHPADNPQIILERQKILVSIEKQIIQIDEARKKLGIHLLKFKQTGKSFD